MRLRLADFGLSAIYRNEVSASSEPKSYRFSPAVVGGEPLRDGDFNILTWSVGTSFYMAPEVLAQRRHGHVDGRDPIRASKLGNIVLVFSSV